MNKAALKQTLPSTLQIAETVMWENIFQLVQVSRSPVQLRGVRYSHDLHNDMFSYLNEQAEKIMISSYHYL